MAELPLIPSTVVGSHGKAAWWYTAVKALEAGEFGPGDLEEMFDDAADTAIRDMERAGLDIITDGEVRRLDGYVDSYYAIIKDISPAAGEAQGRALGLRPADALRGGGADRDAAGRARHRQGVRVRQGAHRPALQGHLCGPAHLRLAHPSGQDLQGRGGRGRALRGGDQRGVQGPGGGGRRDHPARRARAGQCLRRGDGAPLQPGHRGREGQARLSRLLRQSLRPLALRPLLPALLPRPPQGPRRPVRAGIRGARALRARRVEGVRRRPRARRGRDRREGLLSRTRPRTWPSAFAASSPSVPRRSSGSIPTAASAGRPATCATRRSPPSPPAPRWPARS